MGKRKKPKPPKNARKQKQRVGPKQISISSEADYIIQRALEGDARIVRLGALVFFSTQSGDAWLLDIEDMLALCLARLGERQPFRIVETATNISVEWAAHYQIEGEKFMIIDTSGEERTIIGYPTRELMQAM